jgi:hypothetical protein
MSSNLKVFFFTKKKNEIISFGENTKMGSQWNSSPPTLRTHQCQTTKEQEKVAQGIIHQSIESDNFFSLTLFTL